MEFWDPATADSFEGVGARHHAVPNFHLKGFVDRRNQVWLLDREFTRTGMRNTKDIAIKNFYTYLNTEGRPDGRFEQLLNRIEKDAASIFRRITSPIMAGHPLSQRECEILCIYVSFQLIRGPRKRREIELLADIFTRFRLLGMSEDQSYHDPETGETLDLTGIEFLSHPNEHISMAGGLAEKIFECLIDRPIAVFEVTRGSFIICDEPVLVDRSHDPEEVSHKPIGRPDAKNVVHIRPTAVGGVALADEIAMPLARQWLLVLGPRGTTNWRSFMRLDPGKSESLTDEANELLLEQAYQWAASHPDDRYLLNAPLPPLRPLFHLCGLPESYADRMMRLSGRRPQSYGRD